MQAIRAQLLESAEIQLDLFDRFDRGEEIAPSLVSILAYRSLFSALASGSMSVAESLALKMGGRKVDSEECVSRFDLIFGNVMKYFTLNNCKKMTFWGVQFASLPWEGKLAGFKGYHEVFQAYLSGSFADVEVGILNIIKEHQRIGFFVDTTDELISVWGIGLVNLLRAKGVDIVLDDPLIPTQLLI